MKYVCQREEEKVMRNELEPLMNRKQAAEYLGLSPKTLAAWDCTKRHDLRPIKVGPRVVRYRRSELDRFLEERYPTRPN